MPRLYVNLDHVATLRQARRTPYPSVLEAALVAERSGQVHGVTLHLREDRRHVQDRDMVEVKDTIALPFNFEMSVADDIVELCERLRPEQATLVPERREELTTEGGLDLNAHGKRVGEVVERLKRVGILVSLFIDPTEEAVHAANELGAPCIELHTGAYCDAPEGSERDAELERLRRAARLGGDLGLRVNAGHGLTVANVPPIARLPHLEDLNIGHAIVARAVFLGLTEALEEMRRTVDTAAAG